MLNCWTGISFFSSGKKDVAALPILHSPLKHLRHLAPAGISWYPCRVKNVFDTGDKMKNVSRRQLLGPLGIVAGSCVLSPCLSKNLSSAPDKDKKSDSP